MLFGVDGLAAAHAVCYGRGNDQEDSEMKVFKYMLRPGMNKLELPEGSSPLSVIEQRGEVVLYAAVPDAADDVAPEVRRFYALATGEQAPLLPENSTFLGSVRVPGTRVAHVFEVTEALADTIATSGFAEQVA